uniref:ANK_REP_REGION domain-containing protein n=1 Tax=Macrostomum lignano TaxID=282301 RepID=A0A1I8I1W2_9PLAT
TVFACCRASCLLLQVPPSLQTASLCLPLHLQIDEFKIITGNRLAASEGHLEVVKFLVPKVANKAKRDKCCIEAAESAARNRQWEVVKFLVPTVADQTKRDQCCIQAAKSAARNGNLQVVNFLVPKVANKTKRDQCCIKAADSAAK